MDRHCENAPGGAQHLRDRPAVSCVNFTGFDDNPYQPPVKKYLPQVLVRL
jgi:O-acetylhomoserine/O-acetylserine sulfhydrylase-like pyridoxal-dependent enzyme